MPISFVAATIYDNLKASDKEKNSILSRGQIITALVDLVAIVAMAIFAAMIAFHVIDTSAITAYILLGAAVGSTLSNFIAFVIHNYKKFHAKNIISQPPQTIVEDNIEINSREEIKQLKQQLITVTENNADLQKKGQLLEADYQQHLERIEKEKKLAKQQALDFSNEVLKKEKLLLELNAGINQLEANQLELDLANKEKQQQLMQQLQEENEKNGNLQKSITRLENEYQILYKESAEKKKQLIAQQEQNHLELLNEKNSAQQQLLQAKEQVTLLLEQKNENDVAILRLKVEIDGLTKAGLEKAKELSELKCESEKQIKELQRKIDELRLKDEVKNKIMLMERSDEVKFKIVEKKDGDANDNCVTREDETIFVTAAQIEQMKQDPYFSRYVSSSNLDKTVSTGKEFFTNLTIYLKHTIFATNKITSLHSTQLEQQMKQLIEGDFETFFADFGLSNNKAFIKSENGVLETSINLALSCLKHADETGNKALIAFWLTAFQIHFPFDLVIESFYELLNVSLSEPGRLHEMLFVCLANNLDKAETQKFIEDNAGQGILKINLLELKHLFDSKARQLKPCQKLLSLIDWSSVEVIDTKDCNDYPNEAYDEIAVIFNKCTSLLCLRHSGRNTLEQIKPKNTQILIFDLTGYKDDNNWQRSTVMAGASSVPCYLREKPGVFFVRDFQQHKIAFKKYLIKYYDIDMENSKEFHQVRVQVLN